MQEKLGRINLMQTDLPYAALWEEDAVPPREHLLYVSGLPAGSRIGDIAPQLEKAGLGRARLHFRSGGKQVGRAELSRILNDVADSERWRRPHGC